MDLSERDIPLNAPSKMFFKFIQPNFEDPWLSEHIEIVVHDPGAEGTHSELRGKSLFLQLELDHGLRPKGIDRQLRIRWQDSGFLWTGTVRTQPIEISIPQSPAASVCASWYRID